MTAANRGALQLTATDGVSKAKVPSKRRLDCPEASTEISLCRNMLREEPSDTAEFSLAAFETENHGKT